MFIVTLPTLATKDSFTIMSAEPKTERGAY